MARQVTEVTRTVSDDAVQTPVESNTGPSGSTLAERLIYLIGGTLLILLAIRFLLSLLGANRANGFADFIYGVTYPFVAPFFGLFNYDVVYGVARFEVETLVAILVYGLVIWLLARLAGLGRSDRTLV